MRKLTNVACVAPNIVNVSGEGTINLTLSWMTLASVLFLILSQAVSHRSSRKMVSWGVGLLSMEHGLAEAPTFIRDYFFLLKKRHIYVIHVCWEKELTSLSKLFTRFPLSITTGRVDCFLWTLRPESVVALVHQGIVERTSLSGVILIGEGSLECIVAVLPWGSYPLTSDFARGGDMMIGNDLYCRRCAVGWCYELSGWLSS